MGTTIFLAVAAALELALTGLQIATHHYGAIPFTGTMGVILTLILVVHMMRRHNMKKSKKQDKKLQAFFDRSSDET